MADETRMALEGLLRKAQLEGDIDFLRDGVRVLTQALMELEVSQHLGAEKHERTPERAGQRNGYREREWDTRVGTVELRVPRVRDGGTAASFPPCWSAGSGRSARWWRSSRRRTSKAQGVSTRRVDDLVKALGLDGISKSQVSRLCAELDAEVERFRTRRLEAEYPYVWLDATFLKVRRDHPPLRIQQAALVIAVGVRSTGERASGRSLGWIWAAARTEPSGCSSCAA